MITKLDRKLLDTRFGFVHLWTAGSGPDLLLLHQAAQSSDEFLGIVPLLVPNFRVISLDFPGHGASDTPDSELAVPDYCEAAMAVLDAAGSQRTHVFGHHSGGILAVALANAAPDRFGRLALSGAGISDPAVADALLNSPMTRDLPVDADGEFLHQTWSVYRNMSAPETEPATSFLPFVVGLRARLRPYDMHYELLRWDYESSWRTLRHRTLLIKGEHDRFAGDIAGLNDALANSSMCEIPGGGAWLLYEQPHAIAGVLGEFFGDDSVET
ncbi:MAG: alpha/beta hydrolase [Woeseiaceae bacterium]|nr:alpha/beta hydrolase [Woeseiaceae bacterium]